MCQRSESVLQNDSGQFLAQSKQEIHIDCSDDSKQTGAIVIDALNSESIKFNMQIAITKNGQPMNVTVNGTSKWLGATCTDAKYVLGRTLNSWVNG